MKKIYLFGTALLSILSTTGAWAQQPSMTLTGNSLGAETTVNISNAAPAINNCPAVYCNLGTVEMGKTASASFLLEASNLTYDEYDQIMNGIMLADQDIMEVSESPISFSGNPINVTQPITSFGSPYFPLTTDGNGKGSINTTVTATYTPIQVGKDTVAVLFSYTPLSGDTYEAYKTVLFVANVVEEGTSTSLFDSPVLEGITFNGSEIINSQNQTIAVYNTAGQIVASSNKNINMSAYPAGVYVIKAANGASMKIVK